jgi:gelsolin
MAGMKKEKQPDWQDTNLALFGSDIEKKCKAAAADGEPQWDDAGSKVGLQIWRIEQFKVVPWPTNKYGQFHTGDSYILLSTYLKDPVNNPEKLAWDIHFWIGSESTQDEYGTAAYKSVELDHKLGDAAVQHREVESAESDQFVGYFPKGLRYLKGGVASGFRHVEAEKREPVLLHVKGRAGNVSLKQVRCWRSEMNSGDVFILDTEEGIWQWNGSGANAHEKAKASEFTQLLQADRNGKVEVTVLDEGSGPDGDGTGAESKEHGFWKHLPGERKFLGIKYADVKVKVSEKGGDDESVARFKPTLFKLSSRGLRRMWRRDEKPPVSKLRTEHVLLFDTGFQVFIWAGKAAPIQDRTSAFPFAQDYLKRYKRPAVLPIVRLNEGMETTAFSDMFGPAEKPACCVVS